MKHWNRRKGVKTVCFILVPILLAAVLAGSYGMFLIWENGMYQQSRESLEREGQLNLMSSSGDDMLAYVLNRRTGELEIPDNRNLLSWDSNLIYRLEDHTGKTIATNAAQPDSQDMKLSLTFGIYPHTYMEELLVPGEEPQKEVYYHLECWGSEAVPRKAGEYRLWGMVDPEMRVRDGYKALDLALDWGYAMRYWGFAMIGVCLLLAVLCLVNLLATASRRPGSDALFPGKFHKIPSDVMALGLWLVFLWGSEAIMDGYGYRSGEAFSTAVFSLWAILWAYGGLGLLVGAVGRLKQGCLLKNTLTWKLCKFCWRIGKKLIKVVRVAIANLPLVWRTALAALAFGLWALLLWATSMDGNAFSVFLLLAVPVIMAVMMLTSLQLRKLQKAGKALAAGDLDYQVDTQGLFGALKGHGEDLNSIGLGMARAVEGRLRSERMKAELITNVSHDIKNPLTSIINYAGLIAQEACSNPEHQEYSQVLARKSEHLKRLLEDLVEISRATTGNLEIELMPCDAATLLGQLAGEFEDRCTLVGLTLITRQPEEALRIRVDSRRIWRVFENLMNNACKYSLPGTRVYLSLERQRDNAVFTFRNTSREPLDMTPEELMERFVRGDSARTSEGNGLGLSIAQSLTQLQGGDMQLTIDGDLFKVTLTLPLA